MNRREFALTPLVASAACSRPDSRAAEASGWPARWNAALIEHAVKARSLRFDEDKQMIRVILGPEYRYHTKMRECQAHPTRDSLEYALFLLEDGAAASVERARRILARVIALQVTDPASQWYGIWGWYLQEPPDKMAPADWNWADFNGSLLLLAELRHGERLGGELRARVREAIGHAARSVQRRNVSMAYTNIAVKGTFVTLAAAELLGDEELGAYARERIVRLGRQIDETGSFAEYNSPTYARVTLTNLTRIRMFVKDVEAQRRAAAMERRAWLHLASHWDGARMQFTGPMSRCYGNDAGEPVWLEKALERKLGLCDLDQRSSDDGEAAIHDYHCPAEVAPRFLTVAAGTEHRELFIAAPLTQGTSYFGKAFSLGSANRSDFWVQRRPLLGYFGDTGRPARVVQLRVIKDGYDFSSALFFSVQQGPRVLGLINFRNPGGDKHISLDPIKDGTFVCGRLFAELDFEGLPDGFKVTEQDGGVEMQSGLLAARVRVVEARFGTHRPAVKISRTTQSLTLTMDFKPPEGARVVRWSETGQAYLAFTLELAEPGAALSREVCGATTGGGVIRLRWGDLELAGGTGVTTAAAQNSLFEERLKQEPVRMIRLSGERLA
ncbi:MAG TPA: hypothetical protein VGK29_12010 [Paludibaculum sp.]|jgi:hypothetical protein